MPPTDPSYGDPAADLHELMRSASLDRPSACASDETVAFDFNTNGSPALLRASPHESSLGSIGSCELLEEIARGGMGVVYRARQRELGRVVALKIILNGSFSSAAQVSRFHTEAQAAANLHHPNIVTIHEFGEYQGRPYLVMEHIEGDRLVGPSDASAPPDERRVAELVKTIALAVKHAHQQGVIHRDLKPANVLIDRQGAPHIVDFGLAKLTQHDSALTADGAVLGTPSYMAPEQATADSSRIGPPTDVYGLGAILYELLAGRPPFRGESLGATLAMVEKDLPVPPRYHASSASRDLEAICLKCLQKNPADRYATPQALADDLDRFLAGARVHARRRLGAITNLRRPALTAALTGAIAVAGIRLAAGDGPWLAAVISMLGAGLLSFVCVAAICIWNELLLPAWLLSKSSHPLAKAALGLGLVLISLLLIASSVLWQSMGFQTESKGTLAAMGVAAVLAGVIGKMLCLAAAYHGPVQAPLLWSIIADLTAFAINVSQPVVAQGAGEAPNTREYFSSVLYLLGALCFVLAMKRMAREFDEPLLERKARRLLYWQGLFLPIVSAALVGWTMATERREGLLAAVLIVSLAVLFGFVQFARLVRGLQDHVLQRT